MQRGHVGDRLGRREVLDRNVGATHLGVPLRRVVREPRHAAPCEVRRILDMLPQRGWFGGARHVGHLPRASVREGRAVRDYRPGEELGDVRYDDREQRSVLPEPWAAIQRCWHRLGRAQPRGGAKVRFGGVLPLPTGIQGAGLVLELHRLPYVPGVSAFLYFHR